MRGGDWMRTGGGGGEGEEDNRNRIEEGKEMKGLVRETVGWGGEGGDM